MHENVMEDEVEDEVEDEKYLQVQVLIEQVKQVIKVELLNKTQVILQVETHDQMVSEASLLKI